jgi:hypothetical protein
LLHVDAVVEIDEVREIVDARPPERRVVTKARAHRFEDWRGVPDLGVAVHARLGRRDVGKGRLFDAGVAVAAVDPHAADVVRVAELDGLFDVDALIGVVARPVEQGEDGPETADEKQNCQNAEAGIDVAISMEELTHRLDDRAAPYPNA